MKELKTILTKIDDFKVNKIIPIFIFLNHFIYFKIPFFKISTKTLENEDLIGRVYSINKNNSNVADLLKIGKTEFIHLDYHPINLKVLSKDRLLIVNVSKSDYKDDYSDYKLITIHDEGYNVIKKIGQINRELITKISEIAINEEKRELYILGSSLKHRITVTDFELNFIKYFGSWGIGENQFIYPTSICFKNGFLYVCDCLNKRIHKFNQNFEFIKLLELEYEPFKMSVFNSELAVRSHDDSPTYFYDLDSLNFNRKADAFLSVKSDKSLKKIFNSDDNFQVSEIDSMFYKITSEGVNCYDRNGNFIESIHLDEDYNFCDDEELVLFQNTLLMSSFKAKKLIKFQ